MLFNKDKPILVDMRFPIRCLFNTYRRSVQCQTFCNLSTVSTMGKSSRQINEHFPLFLCIINFKRQKKTGW